MAKAPGTRKSVRARAAEESREAGRMDILLDEIPIPLYRGTGAPGCSIAHRGPFLFRSRPNRVQLGKRFGWELQGCGIEVLAKMYEGRCAWNEQDIGRARKEPRKRDLHRRSMQRGRHRVQSRRLERRKPSEREKWHVGYLCSAR